MVKKEDSPDTSRKKTQPQRSQNSQDDAWNNLEDDEDGRYAQQCSERNTSQILENQHSSESQIPIIQGNVSSSKTRDYQRENQTFSQGNDHSSTKQTSPKSSNEQTSQEFSTEQTSPRSSTEQTSPPSSTEQTSPKHIDNADNSSTDSPGGCSSDESSNQNIQHTPIQVYQFGKHCNVNQRRERRREQMEREVSEILRILQSKESDRQKEHQASPHRDDQRSSDQTCTLRSTEQTQPKQIDDGAVPQRDIEGVQGSCEKDQTADIRDPSREVLKCRLKEVVLNVRPSEKPSDSSFDFMESKSTQTSNLPLNVQQMLGKLQCKTTEETLSFKPHPHSLESDGAPTTGAPTTICAHAVGNTPNPFQQTRKESVPSKEQGVKAATWWWKDDVNIWHKYKNDMIEKLETAYKKNPKGLCLLTKNGRSVCVYFNAMTEELLSDETRHEVQRKVVSKDELALLESFNTFSTKEPND